MTNRVVLGAFDGTYVLRSSRPGFDVLNPGLTPEQLVFDSRWNEAGNVFLTETISIPASSNSTQIMFGETFSEPPVVIAFRTSDKGPNTRAPIIAEFIPNFWSSDVYLRNDSFYLTNHESSTRTFYYMCCRNPYG